MGLRGYGDQICHLKNYLLKTIFMSFEPSCKLSTMLRKEKTDFIKTLLSIFLIACKIIETMFEKNNCECMHFSHSEVFSRGQNKD